MTIAYLTSKLGIVYGGASLAREVDGGLESRKTYNRVLFPITALQGAVSRFVTLQFEKIVQTSSFYGRFKSLIQRVVIRNYNRCDKPLALVENTSHILSKFTEKLIFLNPIPYPQAATFILRDISNTAKDLRKVLSFEPKFLEAINKIELIAKDEIIAFLRQKCHEKVNPPVIDAQPDPIEPEQPSGWWGTITNKVSNAYQSVAQPIVRGAAYIEKRVKSPIYTNVPDLADRGLTGATTLLRNQIRTHREAVENKVIPKATDVALSKMCYWGTFIAVNFGMSMFVQLVSSAAVKGIFHASTAATINAYSATAAHALFNTYVVLCLASYTARIAVWKRERIHAEATGAFIQDQITDPLPAIRDVVDTISESFQGAISSAASLIDIDINPALLSFKARCLKEIVI
jgi:hypothetical protein